MGERLTKEREAEIRRVVDKMSFHPTPALVRALLAEIDALRAAPPTTYLHADGTEEPIGELVARLTRERDEARASAEMWSDNAKASTVDLSRAMARAEKAEADLAETRAQLARLREAAEAVDEADASGDDTVLGVAIRNLRAALSTPGHTLAEIERAAQVRALMDAEARWMADHAATPEAVAVAAWLRRCADDLEAGRE